MLGFLLDGHESPMITTVFCFFFSVARFHWVVRTRRHTIYCRILVARAFALLVHIYPHTEHGFSYCSPWYD